MREVTREYYGNPSYEGHVAHNIFNIQFVCHTEHNFFYYKQLSVNTVYGNNGFYL
jgi:hypothetical protein